MRKGCFNCILLLTLCLASRAQQRLNFKTYSFNEGLLSYNIFKTGQDAYGFIWIATQDGLFRFNGKSFEVLKNNTGNMEQTMGNAFLDLAYGPDHKMYAIDYYFGIDIIDAVNWKIDYIGGQKNPAASLPNFWIEKIGVDNRLNLWLGGKGYIAIKRKADSVFTIINKLPGLQSDIKVKFITSLSDDVMAVGVDGYGVVLYNTGSLKQCGFINLLQTTSGAETINDICRRGDTLYALTNSGIHTGILKNQNWLPVYSYFPESFKNLITTSVAADKNKGLWIGSNSGLVYFNTASSQSVVYKADKKKANWLKDNYINHLMIDKEDNLWISTFNVLQMASLRSSPFRSYSGDNAGDDNMDHIYSIVPKNDQEIFCTATDGLYVTNLISGNTKKVPGSQALGLVHHIEKIENDFWLISCAKGMYAYNPASGEISKQKLLQRYPEWNLCIDNYFNNAYRYNDTWYWASEEMEGLVKWDRQKRTLVKFKAGTPVSGGLSENHIRNIRTDREGYLWLLSDATLSKFNMAKDTVAETLYLKNNDNTPDASLFFDMYDDGKTLWFGSYGKGLCGFNKLTRQWRFINEQGGLSNNSVYGILPESDSVFWASTNMGLSRVNHITGHSSNYFHEDGLQDNSFDEKGSLLLKDKMLFGGINGFTAVDLNIPVENNRDFPVYIHYIAYHVQNKKYSIRNLTWNKLQFPNGTNSIEIFLSAVTFTENHKIKFSYKIEGIHNGYIETGNNNSIVLNALGHGNYKIAIGYRKPNGVFVNNALQINMRILPKWHQTWWFKVLIFLTAGGIIYAFYRFRLAQIRKQHTIRKNIATDLHDDLGSTLNSVKVFTNLALSGVKQEENLQQAKENLQEATTGLRDMIWVLDDSLDTADELLTRIKQYAIPVANASNIETSFKADNKVNPYKLTKEEKRNLFLICKEAINNSIKYSGASQIDVDITASGKKIQITIADDGRGFNVDEVARGYGLKNMQYRAEQIDYTIAIVASQDNGTQITVLPF